MRVSRAPRWLRAAAAMGEQILQASCASSRRRCHRRAAGRKWRWNAVTTSRVAMSKMPLAAMPYPYSLERGLQCDDLVAAIARREHVTLLGQRRRLYPMAHAGIVERSPRKFLARVLLARRRNVRMGKDAFGRNCVAGENAAAERRHRGDLPCGKIRIAVIVAGIGDLDADRAGIDVGFAGPGRRAGVPRAAAFLHRLHDAAVLEHEIMGRNFAAVLVSSASAAFERSHPGVVQENHVRPPPVLAFAVIGRGHDFGNDTGVRRKRGAPTYSRL